MLCFRIYPIDQLCIRLFRVQRFFLGSSVSSSLHVDFTLLLLSISAIADNFY